MDAGDAGGKSAGKLRTFGTVTDVHGDPGTRRRG